MPKVLSEDDNMCLSLKICKQATMVSGNTKNSEIKAAPTQSLSFPETYK
jgi:hypothetical protein